MDFFQRQENARRQTGRLILLFSVGLGLMLATIYALAVAVFLRDARVDAAGPWWWEPQLFAWTTLGTLAIVAGGSLFKTLELSRGGAVVAAALGGEPIPPHTTDPDLRRLLNVVEEMSIASGVPMPEVYLLDGEHGINAFAAGTAPDNAVIGVTRGCVQLLNREELQGVIAHEYSHILNGDMRLNLRLIGWIFGIVCLVILGRILLESALRSGSTRRSRDNKDNSTLPLAAIGLAIIVIGSLGAFFGRLIQAAVSRQREHLADAAAVQFTRNPSGLAGALRKIGGLAEGSKLASPQAAEACHMFFANGLNQAWFRLTATHPPLEERIRLLEPAWDGQFPAVTDAEAGPPPPARPEPPRRRRAPSVLAPGLQQLAEADTPLRPGRFEYGLQGATAEHLAFAEGFREHLPRPLAVACQNPLSASALIYGLLLNLTPENAPAQVDAARPRLDAPAHLELTRLAAALATVAPDYRLTLALLALPALRQMTPAQFHHFGATVRALSEADRQLDLFEYALLKAIFRHLRPAFEPLPPRHPQFHSLAGLQAECAILLSALAHVGHPDPAGVQRAFSHGASQLKGLPLTLLPLESCGLTHIDHALDQLALASAPLRARLLGACAHVVAADQSIHGREAELLRAIADTLDCPVPPFLAGV
ncbi:MAG: hypothetical protein RJA22_3264 [Verrucomicrobiota bacterium]